MWRWFFYRMSFSGLFVFALYFSLEHGKIHTLHVPAVDNDDDKLNCQFSSYIEAGFFQRIVRNLTTASIIAMKEKEVWNVLFKLMWIFISFWKKNNNMQTSKILVIIILLFQSLHDRQNVTINFILLIGLCAHYQPQ